MEQEDHDRGLAFDLPTLLDRRRALTLMGGVGVALLVGCGSDSPSATRSASSAPSTASTSTTASSSTTTPGAASSTASSTGDCTTIPEETAGPFPGDGSNGPNVLDQSGVVRSDIRSSFGSSSTVAGGIPLTITLVLRGATTCAALPGAAVYVWHCDREGRYSLYSNGVTNESYLRGVQVADGDGRVTFQSIFPGCYSGRWPHIHFEVHPTVAGATSGGTPAATSQIALPKDTCDLAYATAGYEQSVKNLAQTSLQRDMVFADSYAQELGTVTGSVSSGLTVALDVAVGGGGGSNL
ncbi:MAG: intradiol ring-cleavage dioxygenase [Acidimicrobiales bacterium]